MGQDEARFSRSDRPIEDISQDGLRRGKYVRDLAKFIREYDERESYVIGLYGSWGSGKTSIINLLKRELDSVDEGMPIVTVDYKPWSYLKDEDLTIDFIRTVQERLARFPNHRRAARAIRTVFRAFLGFVGYTSLGGDLAKYADAVIRDRHDSQSVRELKDRIAGKLRKVQGKVVIFVDDLDRLDANEIRSLMKTIKSVLDFPNTVFFLAFDYEIVSRALSAVQGGKGDDYLSKIVQFDTDVPPIDEDTLVGQLFGQCFSDKLRAELDERRLYDVQRLFVRGRVQTLREAKRLVNAYLFRHTSMGDDTDALDLFALTTLEVLDHSFYLWIAANRAELVGLWLTIDREKTVNAMREKLARELGDDARLEMRWRQLGHLFPRYGDSAGGLGRPAHPCALEERDYTDHYFSDVLPEASVSAEEIRGLLEVAKAEPPTALALRIAANGKQYTAARRLNLSLEEPSPVGLSLDQRRNLALALLPTMRFEPLSRDDSFFSHFIIWRHLLRRLLGDLGPEATFELLDGFIRTATAGELLGLAFFMREEDAAHDARDRKGEGERKGANDRMREPLLDDEAWELLRAEYLAQGARLFSGPDAGLGVGSKTSPVAIPDVYRDANAIAFLGFLKVHDEGTWRDIIRRVFKLPFGVCYFSSLIITKGVSADGPIYGVYTSWLPDEMTESQLVELIDAAVRNPAFWRLPDDLQHATAIIYAALVDEEAPVSLEPGTLEVQAHTVRTRLTHWRTSHS